MSSPSSVSFSGNQRFRLEKLLGRGASGAVYAAFDTEQRRAVALKLLTNWHPLAIERFKNEFRALQDVRHRNLVELRELLFEDGQWFLTMELVRGVDFLAHVRGQTRRAEPTWSDSSPSNPTLSAAAEPEASGRADSAGGSVDEARLRDAFAQLV